MKSKEEDIINKSFVISELYKGKTFKSFRSLRKRINDLLAKERDDWLDTVLAKHNIFIDKTTMTRRQIIEIFHNNLVRVLDEDKVYTVYKDYVLIGEWKRCVGIYMNQDGKMEVKIQYTTV